jgi:hypothetical protein
MRAAHKPHVDSSKHQSERAAKFGKGGAGAPNKMLCEVPAEPAPAGRTGPAQAKAPGAKAARGGARTPANIGRVSRPAKAGATGSR